MTLHNAALQTGVTINDNEQTDSVIKNWYSNAYHPHLPHSEQKNRRSAGCYHQMAGSQDAIWLFKCLLRILIHLKVITVWIKRVKTFYFQINYLQNYWKSNISHTIFEVSGLSCIKDFMYKPDVTVKNSFNRSIFIWKKSEQSWMRSLYLAKSQTLITCSHCSLQANNPGAEVKGVWGADEPCRLTICTLKITKPGDTEGQISLKNSFINLWCLLQYRSYFVTAHLVISSHSLPPLQSD